MMCQRIHHGATEVLLHTAVRAGRNGRPTATGRVRCAEARSRLPRYALEALQRDALGTLCDRHPTPQFMQLRRVLDRKQLASFALRSIDVQELND